MIETPTQLLFSINDAPAGGNRALKRRCLMGGAGYFRVTGSLTVCPAIALGAVGFSANMSPLFMRLFAWWNNWKERVDVPTHAKSRTPFKHDARVNLRQTRFRCNRLDEIVKTPGRNKNGTHSVWIYYRQSAF